MRALSIGGLAATAVLAVAAAACSRQDNTAQDSARACDRDCLLGVADAYLDALAANDPAAAPLADDVAFVENITRMSPGEGLWQSAAGATDFRIFVPDPAAGAVGMMVVMDRRGAEPALVAIRLKLEDGRIVEAEHVVGEAALVEGEANLDAPRPDFAAVVPESERASREELTTIAATYYEALNQNDGDIAPFADDCERQENGVVTASPDLGPAPFEAVNMQGDPPPPVARDCTGQISSGRFAYVDDLLNRRVFAADPVTGLAMGLSHFTASMSHGAHLMTAADGTQVLWEEDREPYDLPAAHIFKITGGEIHEVEAVGFFTDYDSPTGWE